MGNNWKTSINELLLIFRGALIAIIPWLEKANIKWKEGEAYDDWDNITESLYQNIVTSSLIGEVSSNHAVAKYNFHYKDYTLIDFIQIQSKNHADKTLAFVSFQSNSSPFDRVKVAKLNKSDKVVGYLNLKQDDVMFTFLKNKDGKKITIHEIDVIM